MPQPIIQERRVLMVVAGIIVVGSIVLVGLCFALSKMKD